MCHSLNDKKIDKRKKFNINFWFLYLKEDVDQIRKFQILFEKFVNIIYDLYAYKHMFQTSPLNK